MPELVVKQIHKRFGRQILFEDLSFSLSGGHSLAVTGHNGSGKSTLLQIIAGVQRPSSGKVSLRLNGHALADEDRPLNTGLVAPYLNVYAGFSARENLAFLARARGMEQPEARIERLLEKVGLARRAGDLVSTYSSGMQRRVSYAAALLAEPPLLLLDEPTTNLDEAGLMMVREVMDEQISAGRLLVLATNVPEEATWCEEEVRLGRA